MRVRLLFLIISVVLFNHGVSAEIFKCIDEVGTIKYQENECFDNEKSTHVKVREIKSSGDSNVNAIKNFTEEQQVRKSKSQMYQEELILKQQKANEKKCGQLRRKLATQEQNLYKKCKKGLNTFCKNSAMDLDRKLNRFYTTDKNGFDTNKYVHFNLNGQRYKSAETPLLKIISDLQANQCTFKMPN